MQRSPARGARVWGAALVLAGACAVSAHAAEEGAGGEPRATMGEIFKAVRFVLPYSLDPERFGAPGNREALLASLDLLARNAARLEAHGQGRDESFLFLSRSLAWDVAEARRRFADGELRQARFVFYELVRDCVACHSRLPSDRDSPLGRRLMEEEAVAALEPEERAKLEMATRQFDAALTTFEASFRSPDSSPDYLDLMGHLDDYLEIAIRVKRDPARAIPVLEAFRGRPDVSKSLAENLDRWLEDLRALTERSPAAGSELEQGRRWLRQAEDRDRYPYDRMALVPYVAASGALLRWVTDHANEGKEAAEAYYLLGLCESRIGRSETHSQAEFYLVTAIRLAPGGELAEHAYALLEDFLVSGFTGSAGVNVPDDVKQLLEDLQRLMDEATRASQERA